MARFDILRARRSLMPRFRKAYACAVVVLVTGAAIPAGAQAPAPAQAPANANANIVVDNPTYVTIPLEIDVNRPAAEVWKRVGKYCDIAEWLQIGACKIIGGKDGEIGAVRSVASEVLVGKSDLSYTYTQTVKFQGGGNRPY